ncbi:MAG: hypothetical protein ACK59A_03480 [Cyanobacteriota bacterium]
MRPSQRLERGHLRQVLPLRPIPNTATSFPGSDGHLTLQGMNRGNGLEIASNSFCSSSQSMGTLRDKVS